MIFKHFYSLTYNFQVVEIGRKVLKCLKYKSLYLTGLYHEYQAFMYHFT